MKVEQILNYVEQLIGLGSDQRASFALLLLLFPVAIKILSFFIKRLDSKDDKQFEVIYKLIDDDEFSEKLNNSPYLIKQIFYRRLYLFKGYKVEEMEFLLLQDRIDIDTYDLSDLKAKGLISFKHGKYQSNRKLIVTDWIENYILVSIEIILFFIIMIWLIAILAAISVYLYYVGLMLLFTLEAYLLLNHESVKIYKNDKDEIDRLISASRQYKEANEQHP